MPADALLGPLLALDDERAGAPATDPPWPGRSHAAIRTSPSYSALAGAASAENPELARLMAGATLTIAHDLGGYSTTIDGLGCAAARRRQATGRSARADRPPIRAPRSGSGA